MPAGYSSIFKFIHVLLMDFRKSLSTHLFLPYLSNLRTRNEFTDLLSMFAHISLRGKIVHYCREIRDPVWSYILIDLCSSFAARDCNACFSQIFENLRKEHLVVSMKRKRAFS